VEYYATTPFDLTLADGSSVNGTVTFTVGGETATKACYADALSVGSDGAGANDDAVITRC